MNAPLTLDVYKEVVYPDSDGQPMADNTKQFRWIVTIKENLESLFIGDPHVFVAGDLLWYPEEGNPKIRQAPDIFVVFGRPKGDRGSYKQWLEDGLSPQVVFEIWSPGNRPNDLIRKRDFYEKYGPEEFYLYDPDTGDLSGYLRQDGKFQEIADMKGWVSPRLGIRFDLEGDELVIYRPEGQRFLTFVEVQQQRDEAVRKAEEASKRVQQEARRAEKEARRAEKEARRADDAEAELGKLRARLKGSEPKS